MFNQITLCGRLGAEPEIKQVGGQTMARFRLATTDKWTDKAGERQERTEWHTVEVWGRKAEVAGQYLGKGSVVLVTGKLTYHKNTNEAGVITTYANIRADNFQMLGGGPS